MLIREFNAYIQYIANHPKIIKDGQTTVCDVDRYVVFMLFALSTIVDFVALALIVRIFPVCS